MDSAALIDWRSSEAIVLLNPRMPEADRLRLQRLAESSPLPGHIWIATSGTTGQPRLVALSRDAFLVSAAAFNQRFEASERDVWLAVLPLFHVGGLAIFARATLAGSSVLQREWSPASLDWSGVTLASLVPAQLHDLVAAGQGPPPTLRRLFIGGGALSPGLAATARALGWPLVVTYGMTECASMIAADEDGHGLRLLSHVDARLSPEGLLEFRSQALLTAFATEEEGRPTFTDPRVEGWFRSEDVGRVVGDRRIEIEGRRGDVAKVGGELVSLARLELILTDVLREVKFPGDAALLFASDRRLENVVELLATAPAAGVVEEFGRRVLPFERIRSVRIVAEIPRTALGKVIRAAVP